MPNARKPAIMGKMFSDRRLMALCDGKNVHLIGCSHVVDQEEAAFMGISHFSDAGHKFLAEHLCRQLEPLLAKCATSEGKIATP